MTKGRTRATELRDLPAADLALVLLAVDPAGLAGARIRGSAAAAWVETAANVLQPFNPIGAVRRLPSSASMDRIRGGLDLAASLAARSPRVAPGVLAEADGGVLTIHGADRLEPEQVAAVAAALDTGETVGADLAGSQAFPARFALLMSDEASDDGVVASGALAERVAFHVDAASPPSPRLDLLRHVPDARRRLRTVRVKDNDIEALCAAAQSVGATSMRTPMFALRAACAHAALAGRSVLACEDLSAAATLVVAPRARQAPPERPDVSAPPEKAETVAASSPSASSDSATGTAAAADVVIEAVRSALPSELLTASGVPQTAGPAGGRHTLGRWRTRATRGSRSGVRRAGCDLKDLALAETLKAAAPWRRVRSGDGVGSRIPIWPSDLRAHRRKPSPRGLVTLLVDASGSSAAQRLAEAKGAVELLLDRCYARRDEVSLVTFRGEGAQVVLPPTRSLTRVRRLLGEMAAGGATPLATALDLGSAIAAKGRDKGMSPLVLVLSDGRANVARDGAQGRAAGHADAMDAASAFRRRKLAGVVLDTSPRGEVQARALAEAMGVRYARLPYVQAEALVEAVSQARP